MTVETEVANLTTAVDNLTSAVNVSKATLDASVADSESARDQSQDARDTASLHKLAAEAAATSATNTAAALTGFDLEAIAESKAVTAVDVFVYDTSKDSDGGAWRKRTQSTSWYNETLNTATRGSRREFPAVAVIVAEVDKVTIYDGDDPSLPMWMVFDDNNYTSPQLWRFGRPATSIAAQNGVICVGTNFDVNGGLITLDLLKDQAQRITAPSTFGGINVAERNSNITLSVVSSTSLVNFLVNDVAMTVLPDAPIDAATGLPVPTIAVGCGVSGQPNGGTSIIHNDGTVVDLIANPGAGGYVTYALAFGQNNELITMEAYGGGSYSHIHIFDDLPTADVPNMFTGASRTYSYHSSIQVPSVTSNSNPTLIELVGADSIYAGYTNRLTHLFERKADKAKGMVAYTTSTYNTGWMNGDIKGAFLSDTDDTDLVGAELVTNGTFDTNVNGWDSASGGILAQSGGNIVISGVPGDTAFAAVQEVATEIGKSYSFSADIVGNAGGNAEMRLGTTIATSNIYTSGATLSTGTFKTTFKASSASTWISLYGYGDGNSVTFDNISVKLADADRSVNNNGLIVNGTVARSPVATGADLVAYSGFSTSNYLEQPYNADLDFGTGDFSIMGWVKSSTPTDGDKTIIGRQNADFSGQNWKLFASNSTGYLSFGAEGVENETSVNVCNSTWNFVCFVRSGGVVYLYANGVLALSGSNATDVSNSTASLGIGVNLVSPPDGAWIGSLALLRISATAPTAEQVAKIYNDEKVLFQDNAQATLYGASDAVTALAHDPDTDLLHVGTSAGRSVFQGLRRVSNTTTAVGTAISASNGLVVEE